MTFMLSMSVQILPLAVLLPQLWLGLGLLAVVAWRANRTPPRLLASPARLALEHASLLTVPLLMLWLGVAFWEADASNRSALIWVLWVLAALQLVLALSLVWRHRSRVGPSAAFSGLALLWTAGAVGVGSMAVTGIWL